MHPAPWPVSRPSRPDHPPLHPLRTRRSTSRAHATTGREEKLPRGPPRPRTSLSVWIEQPALESQSVGRDFQNIPVRKHAWLSVDTSACGQLIRRSGATDVNCHEGKPGGVPSQVAAVGRGRGGHSGTRGGRAGVAGAQGSSVLCDVLASAGVPGGRRPRSLVSADGQVGGVHGLSPLTPGPPAPSCFCHIWLFLKKQNLEV